MALTEEPFFKCDPISSGLRTDRVGARTSGLLFFVLITYPTQLADFKRLTGPTLDIAAKRHKIHKKIIYILEYQIVMGVKNIDLNFLQDYQPLCLGISIPLLFAPCPMLFPLSSALCSLPYALCSMHFLLSPAYCLLPTAYCLLSPALCSLPYVQ